MRVASCNREILHRLNLGTLGSRSTEKRAACEPGWHCIGRNQPSRNHCRREGAEVKSVVMIATIEGSSVGRSLPSSNLRIFEESSNQLLKGSFAALITSACRPSSSKYDSVGVGRRRRALRPS